MRSRHNFVEVLRTPVSASTALNEVRDANSGWIEYRNRFSTLAAKYEGERGHPRFRTAGKPDSPGYVFRS